LHSRTNRAQELNSCAINAINAQILSQRITMNSLTLLPMPRELKFTSGSYLLKANKRIVLQAEQAGDLLLSAQRLQMALSNLARVDWALAATAPAQDTGVTLRVDSAQVTHAQGYELTITPDAITIVAHDNAGVFYGVCTLIQILENAAQPENPKVQNPKSKVQSSKSTTAKSVPQPIVPSTLPCLHINDYPDFPARGVMLDISRDRVPTMDTLYALVDMLASWKINEFQLYTEHTFTYRKHPKVWAMASPMTEEEILELDAYCKRRYIDLVPNQNSFGHLRRWLTLPEYRDLSEAPNGCDTAWGHFDEPFTLNPLDPRSLQLVRDMFDELLPNFSSRLVNVGCDETMDLGKDRSKAEAEKRGVGRVYLDFLLKIYDEVKKRGRTMQFWGDIILHHPELIPELPKDVIALEWGYDATHPFDANCAKFAQAGVPFYVCPGTSSWNTIAGRTGNALANLLNAAENGLKHGAIGFLNTDWGDNGHWQAPSVSYLGYAYGAGMAWAAAENREIDIVDALNRFAFRDTSGTMGQVAYDMGNVYQSLGYNFRNASGLVRALYVPTGSGSANSGKAADVLAGVRALGDSMVNAEAYQRAEKAIAAAMKLIKKQKMQRSDANLIVAEYELAADLLHHACGLGQLAWEDDKVAARKLKRLLAADLKRIIKEYRLLWLMRSRVGGLAESVARLGALLAVYR
jgi:hypothetical protein